MEVALSMKYGSLVMPMSTTGDEWNEERNSSAIRVIMTRRSGKAAGSGDLSALTVARRKSTRDFVWDAGGRERSFCELDAEMTFDALRAFLTSARCALEGGLKDESRT